MVPVTPPPGEQGGLEKEDERSEEQQPQDEDKGEEIQQEGDAETNAEGEDEQEPEELCIPAEFMFGVNMIPIDPKLLMFMERTRKGKGGKRSKLYNLERGRFCKAIFPKGGQHGRIAIGATLRAAAPFQKLRRRLAEGTKRAGKAVHIDKSDFRIKRMTRKSGALVIFVVDASGSMALNRMDAAKGAAISLLSEAYKARDKISLISFHQERADVVVPPTKSTALTKSRLESMPCGGGSPLAHALLIASKVAINEKKVKKDVGKVVIVLLTDGRCNVPLCISNGEGFDPKLFPSLDGKPTKEFLEDEAISCARSYRKLGLDLLVIDTEDKFVATGIAKVR
jgi:magnesium chelatase subunit D